MFSLLVFGTLWWALCCKHHLMNLFDFRYSVPASEKARLKSVMQHLVPDLIESNPLSWLDSVMVAPYIARVHDWFLIKMLLTIYVMGHWLVQSFSVAPLLFLVFRFLLRFCVIVEFVSSTRFSSRGSSLSCFQSRLLQTYVVDTALWNI